MIDEIRSNDLTVEGILLTAVRSGRMLVNSPTEHSDHMPSLQTVEVHVQHVLHVVLHVVLHFNVCDFKSDQKRSKATKRRLRDD